MNTNAPLLPTYSQACPEPPSYFNSEIAQVCILITARINGLYQSLSSLHSNTSKKMNTLKVCCENANNLLKSIEVFACENDLLSTSTLGTRIVDHIVKVSNVASRLGGHQHVTEFNAACKALMWSYATLLTQQLTDD